MGLRNTTPNKNFLSRNLTVYLDQSQVNEMKKYPEVNWSIVARIAFRKYCENRRAKRDTNPDNLSLGDGNKIQTATIERLESDENNG